MVDNHGRTAAPVVVEDNPTQRTLFGSIEHGSDADTVQADHTGIHAGSLLKAHGGFILLHLHDLAAEEGLWQRLRRFLRCGRLQIEEGGGGPGHGPGGAVALQPEPVDVDAGSATVPARRYVAGHGRMICWVHGGPTDQWQVEFLPRVAYWWAQGWDVLVPDPRGSTGHGRRHQQALHGEWGRADVDDTAAVLAHAHRSGWSTPSTTALIGGSSGGLTVLGVLSSASLLGVAFSLYLVNNWPLLLVALSPLGRHLLLVAPAVDPAAFVLVVVARRMLFYTASFFLGRALGPGGIVWIETRAAAFGRFVRWIEALFARWSYPVVFFASGPTVSALAGISGMRPALFAGLACSGSRQRCASRDAPGSSSR